MYFLKDFVTPSPTQGNLISCNEDSNEIEELHSVENNENNLLHPHQCRYEHHLEAAQFLKYVKGPKKNF
ncbi:unnamed protein product [Acanthoscelides obtectus]|uniref:Uncharacterized protein n=1 Tax=Acanthoscelides obtectus TaxID=200917 RepID=A0A9P0Q9X8_ACAOB|nr:unnamed protein product [Acanthoscelides obtectus]CAK1632897.1 hypothetical protein AOBTE_LOCUS7801 [Acanthoscelides obtectus]